MVTGPTCKTERRWIKGCLLISCDIKCDSVEHEPLSGVSNAKYSSIFNLKVKIGTEGVYLRPCVNA